MSFTDESLAVYRQALGRIHSGVATMQDEVVVALWDVSTEQAKTIREQANKISMLEMKDSESYGTIGILTECGEIMQRIGWTGSTTLQGE
jgi:hypothetical protein